MAERYPQKRTSYLVCLVITGSDYHKFTRDENLFLRVFPVEVEKMFKLFELDDTRGISFGDDQLYIRFKTTKFDKGEEFLKVLEQAIPVIKLNLDDQEIGYGDQIIAYINGVESRFRFGE